MKVLLFVLLKAAEISLVVFGPHYLGWPVHPWAGFVCEHSANPPACAPFWIIGFFTLFFGALFSGILSLFVVTNWKWADILLENIRTRLSS